MLFIVNPDITKEEFDKILDEVREIVKKLKGELLLVDIWGERELAYPIKKKNRGTYVVVHFKGSPDVVNELDRRLKIISEVWRHIIVKITQKMHEDWKRKRNLEKVVEQAEVLEKVDVEGE